MAVAREAAQLVAAVAVADARELRPLIKPAAISRRAAAAAIRGRRARIG